MKLVISIILLQLVQVISNSIPKVLDHDHLTSNQLQIKEDTLNKQIDTQTRNVLKLKQQRIQKEIDQDLIQIRQYSNKDGEKISLKQMGSEQIKRILQQKTQQKQINTNTEQLHSVSFNIRPWLFYSVLNLLIQLPLIYLLKKQIKNNQKIKQNISIISMFTVLISSIIQMQNFLQFQSISQINIIIQVTFEYILASTIFLFIFIIFIDFFSQQKLLCSIMWLFCSTISLIVFFNLASSFYVQRKFQVHLAITIFVFFPQIIKNWRKKLSLKNEYFYLTLTILVSFGPNIKIIYYLSISEAIIWSLTTVLFIILTFLSQFILKPLPVVQKNYILKTFLPVDLIQFQLINYKVLNNKPDACCLCFRSIRYNSNGQSQIIRTACLHLVHQQCLITAIPRIRRCPICQKDIFLH